MKKQTVVEWLKDWMGENQYFIGYDLLEAIEQAKAMEKEEIENAWNSAYGGDANHTGKEYFQQTYGGDK